jgi:thiamine biosynthesis lipoprotein
LNEVIGAALRVASATDYLVDPTVGAAVIALGYDRDVSQLVAASGVASPATGLADYSRPNSVPAGLDRVPAPGGWRIGHDAESRVMCLPSGVAIDLGASAKAFAADRAATQIAEQLRCGALVSLGGDVAVAGETPRGGWRVAIGESHRTAEQHRDDMVAITSGLATSSIAVRRWRDPAGGTAHHIIDPRTGANPPACWRTVSAVAASCVDANAATTAAIVLGPQAPGWLRARRIPARLTGTDCSVVTVSGWPADRGGVGQDDGAGR